MKVKLYLYNIERHQQSVQTKHCIRSLNHHIQTFTIHQLPQKRTSPLQTKSVVFKTFVQYRMRLILHQTHVVCQKRDLETDNFNLRHFKSDRRRLMALLYYQQCRTRCKKSRIIGDVDHNSSRQDPRASSLLDKIGPFFLFLISPGSDFGISTEVIVMNQSLVWNFTKQAFFVCNSFVPLLLNSREIAGR